MQDQLVANVLAEGVLKDDTINQAMWFGNLPGWAMDVIPLLPCQYFPPEVRTGRNLSVTLAVHLWKWHLLFTRLCKPNATHPNNCLGRRQLLRRRPLFDQLSVNAYTPGEGLKPHIDLAKFEDGICIVSLKSAAIMNFRQADSAYDVLLEPGDVLLLSGQSRSVPYAHTCWFPI